MGLPIPPRLSFLVRKPCRGRDAAWSASKRILMTLPNGKNWPVFAEQLDAVDRGLEQLELLLAMPRCAK